MMRSTYKLFYPLLLISLATSLSSCMSTAYRAPTQSTALSISQAQPAQHVALLLPLSGPLASAGQAVRDGFLTAYYQAKQQAPTPTINFYNTASSQDIQTLYQFAVEQGADLILGPLEKDQVARLAQTKLSSVPTILLNEPPAHQTLPSHMLQFSLAQTDEAIQVAKQAWQAGQRRALMITPAGAWGTQIGEAFTQAWQAQGGTLVDSIALQNGQNVNLAIQHLLQINYITQERVTNQQRKIRKQLPQARQDADMIFMALPPTLARQINPLLQFYYANHLSLYTTSLAIADHSIPNESLDMQNVIVCDMPWVLEHSPYTEHASQKSRFYALGLDIYKLSQNLAQLNTTTGTQGKTGTLYLGPNNQIVRALICTPFRQLTTPSLSAAKSQSFTPPRSTLEPPDNNELTDNDDFISL